MREYIRRRRTTRLCKCGAAYVAWSYQYVPQGTFSGGSAACDACRNEHARADSDETSLCRQCGETFTLTKRQVHSGELPKTCSPECKADAQRVYADDREREREKKRRYRQKRKEEQA